MIPRQLLSYPEQLAKRLSDMEREIDKLKRELRNYHPSEGGGSGPSVEVNDGLLTLQRNGTTLGGFSANQATNATLNIQVPTKTSDIANDSGYITNAAIPTNISAFNNDVGYLTSVSWGDVSGKPSFALVATTGDYNDLQNLPTIPVVPTNVSAFTNDAGYLTSVDWTDVLNKPPFATVASTGDYNDLLNTPVIPPGVVLYNTTGYNTDGAMTQKATTDALDLKADTSSLSLVATTGDYGDLSNTPSLALVATSGDYNDLTNKPSDRLYRMLVPTGTEITSNKNLNTVEFLVVGRYYCPANVTVATLTNCPTGSAFMMEVFSPLSTTIDDETTRAWCYRTRILTTFTGEMYVQSCSTNATPNNWSYGSWRRFDVPGVKNATTQTHTDYNNNQDYLPNMRFLSFWNGAYNSSNNSNLKYFASSSVTTANLQDGCVTAAKLNDRNTANTTDTWMLVLNGDKIQHRVVKKFNSDGSIPSSALSISNSTEAHLGSSSAWHMLYLTWSNSSSGWQQKDFTLPSGFNTQGRVKHVTANGLWGNSGDNRLGAWIQMNGSTLRIRYYQASSGSNGWSMIVFGIW